MVGEIHALKKVFRIHADPFPSWLCNSKYIQKAVYRNYLSKYFDDVPEDEKWNKCFDISDAEFKVQIVKIYRWCANEIVDLNYNKLPDGLTKTESSMIGNSIDQCAKTKFIVMNKEKFVYDKHTKQIDRCLKTYQFIYSLE